MKNIFRKKNTVLKMRRICTALLFIVFICEPVGLAFAQEVSTSTSPDTTISDSTSSSSIPTDSTLPVVIPAVPDIYPRSSILPLDTNAPSTDDASLNPTAKITSLSSPSGPVDLTIDARTATFEKQVYPGGDSSGGFSYSFPINLPPGREGMTPSLALSYNSQNLSNNSILGYGWTTNIPYIERLNKTGVDTMYSQNYFSSSIGGELATTSNPTIFYQRVDSGSFLKYVLATSTTGSTWTVTAKDGKTYLYGESSGSRLDNVTSSTQVSKWFLEEVTDTNKNSIKYQYTKDAGAVYPQTITYTNSSTTGAVVVGIYTVNFILESNPYAITQYNTGFAVTNGKRIKEIDVLTNSVKRRYYTLQYSTDRYGIRNFITSILETGVDANSVETSLPATSYQYNDDAVGFSYNSAYSWAPSLTSTPNVPGDVNGDGLIDFSVAANAGTSITSTIMMNEGQGNQTTVSTPIPEPFSNTGASNLTEYGSRMVDINGDLLPDIIRSVNGSSYWGIPRINTVYLNNRLGWNASTTNTWSNMIPVNFETLDGNAYISPSGTALADVNGDGLPDMMYSDTNNFSARYLEVNTGSAWASSSVFDPPFALDLFGINGSYYDPAVRISDLNGDGLDDFALSYIWDQGSSSGTSTGLDLNSGLTGWVATSTIIFPEPFTSNSLFGNTGGISSQVVLGTRIVDVNGDGLPDVVRYDSGGAINRVYINTGRGFLLSSSTVPANVDDTYDINGDGMVDFGANLNTARPYGLMNKISYPAGGTTSLGYKASADYQVVSTTNQNPKLPFIIQTVNTIVTNDALGNIGTTTMTYQNGEYYYNSPLDRKFSGFEKVTKNNGLSTQVDYYHQGNGDDSTAGEANDAYGKIGNIFKTEIFDTSSNALLSRTQNIYSTAAISGASSPGGFASSSPVFVFLSKKIDETYNPLTGTHRDHAVEYSYNTTNGNLVSSIDRGEVTSGSTASTASPTFLDIGTDLASTTIIYAASSTPGIFLPSDTLTQDQSGNPVSETRHYYDSQSLGGLLTGNETKTEMWKSASNYASTTKTYDGTYGLMTQTTDAIGNPTTFTYDTYHMYPATTTNAKSQATGYTYDYALGKVKTTYDPNGFFHSTLTDGLGRSLAILEPNLSTGTLATTTAFIYTDSTSTGATSVQRIDYVSIATSTATTTNTYTYLDGFGKTIQTRKQAEGSNTYAVKDSIYNSFGVVASESLPYFASSTSRSTATSTATLYTTYGYDALLRVATSSNAVGSTTNVYDRWTVSTTDPNGHVKDYTKDVYGNLVSVVEHNAASAYTTAYTYDLNKNLTNITDAVGNVRNFTYDGLGRRLTAEDLHAVGDSSFGSYTYTYDDQGNVKTVTDPNSTSFSYTYDVLNRPLVYAVTSSSVPTIPTGTKIQYTYDTGGSCSNGAGHVCSILYADDTFGMGAMSTTTYQYNPRGQVQTEIKTIRGKGIFATGYSYDNAGNQVLINQPDGNNSAYVYNTAGLVDSMTVGTSTPTTVAKFTHSPLGQVATIVLGSGATTTNTFDAAHLYRLANKSTLATLLSTATTSLQNLSYTYDPVGNITQIADTSNTNTAKTTYYTYDPLNRLLSASTTGASSVVGGDYLQTYTYDPIGNITYKSDVGTYHYDGNIGTNYANPHAVTSITMVQPAPVYIQSTSTDQISSAKTTSLSFIASTTAHNLMVVAAVWSPTANVASISDSQGNTFATSINGFHNGASNTYQQLWYAYNIAGGADTVTLTTFATTTERKLAIHEYSGLATSTAALGAWIGANHATSTAVTTAGSSTSGSNQLIFAFDSTSAGGVTAGSGYALRQSDAFGGTEDAISTGSSSVTPAFAQTSGSWGAEGVVLKTPGTSALATYTYDHAGNLLTTTGTNPSTYAWDYNNRIASSTNASTIIQYAYDQSGQRVAQKNTGTSITTLYPTNSYDIQYTGTTTATSTQTEHLSSEGTLLATLTTPVVTLGANAGTCVFSSTASTTLTSNCTVTGTVVLPYSLTVSSSTEVTMSATSTLLVDLKHNKVLVKKGSGILIKHGGTLRQTKTSDTLPTLSYDLTDHLGSVVLTTDASSTITQLSEYYPYGSVRSQTGAGKESKGYISQMFDSGTQLNYLNARYYEGNRGQFLSEDPMFWSQKMNLQNPQSLNAYSYTEDNPINKSDPTGLASYIWDNGAGMTGIDTWNTGTYYQSGDNAMLQADGARMSAEGSSIGGLVDFAALNWSGSTWDYKSRANPSSGDRQFYFFGDQLVSADTYGNYHYGYVGTAAGYSSSVLQSGGGFAQVVSQLVKFLQEKSATLYSASSYFNNPLNPPKIQYGISTYAANFSSSDIQTRSSAVSSFNSSSGATSNEGKLWTTPNGAVVTWSGGVVSSGISK